MQYRDWHYGGMICEVPVSILLELENFFDIFTKKEPDRTAESYKQWNVQISKVVPSHEITYIHWQDENLLKNTKLFFNKYVSRICRFRFSLLNEDSEVEYHSKHQLPRIHIPLNDCISQMIIQDDNGIENIIPLQYGNAYYTNVTKLHKVTGDVNKVRRNAFFCFTDFVDLKLKNQYT